MTNIHKYSLKNPQVLDFPWGSYNKSLANQGEQHFGPMTIQPWVGKIPGWGRDETQIDPE